MATVFAFILFAGVVVFLVWNCVSLVRDLKGRKKRKNVKNLPDKDNETKS